jgi:hypothetical protein
MKSCNWLFHLFARSVSALLLSFLRNPVYSFEFWQSDVMIRVSAVRILSYRQRIESNFRRSVGQSLAFASFAGRFWPVHLPNLCWPRRLLRTNHRHSATGIRTRRPLPSTIIDSNFFTTSDLSACFVWLRSTGLSRINLLVDFNWLPLDCGTCLQSTQARAHQLLAFPSLTSLYLILRIGSFSPMFDYENGKRKRRTNKESLCLSLDCKRTGDWD